MNLPQSQFPFPQGPQQFPGLNGPQQGPIGPQQGLGHQQGIGPQQGPSLFDGSKFNSGNENPEKMGIVPEQMQLIEAGIPLEIVLGGDDDAIRKYAQDNGISIPAKGNPSVSSTSVQPEKTEDAQDDFGLKEQELGILKSFVDAEISDEDMEHLIAAMQDNDLGAVANIAKNYSIELPDVEESTPTSSAKSKSNEFGLNPQQQEVLDLFIEKNISQSDMEHVINALQSQNDGAVALIAQQYDVELPERAV